MIKLTDISYDVDEIQRNIIILHAKGIISLSRVDLVFKGVTKGLFLYNNFSSSLVF